MEKAIGMSISYAEVDKLMSYRCESERLDYKEMFAPTWKRGKKQSLVNLVCDIVSMANSSGGFIIFGVRDNADGTFTPVGVSHECMRVLTAERLQMWLKRYVEPALRLLVAAREVDGKNFVVIRVEKSPLPVPFRISGQYEGRKGDLVSKFHGGDIYCRHGATSERATYLDIVRMFEEIREDERHKANASSAYMEPVIERLDMILLNMDGGGHARKSKHPRELRYGKSRS